MAPPKRAMSSRRLMANRRPGSNCPSTDDSTAGTCLYAANRRLEPRGPDCRIRLADVRGCKLGRVAHAPGHAPEYVVALENVVAQRPSNVDEDHGSQQVGKPL